MYLDQHALNSPFNAFSTAAEVLAGVDLSGKFAIVTGGYSGLGLEASRALVEAGATVIVPARNPAKARAAVGELKGVEIVPMDLTNSPSIVAFANRFLESGRPLTFLINSAGIMATPLFRDADGHEGQFATNHLGHFRLVRALWPSLVASRGARVISVSSRGHLIAGVDFDDIDFFRRPYDRWEAYGQSKTANILFAVALDVRGKAQGVRSFALHPGQVLTDLARHLSPQDLAGFQATDKDGNRRVDPENDLKTPQQGAATMVWAATSPVLNDRGGLYLEDCNVAPLLLNPDDRKGVAPYALDLAKADKLWAISEAM